MNEVVHRDLTSVRFGEANISFLRVSTTLSRDAYLQISLQPEQERMIYTTATSVVIMDYKLQILKTFEVNSASIRVQNNILWVVSMNGDEYIEVSVFDLNNFEKLDAIKIEEDSLFEASVCIEDGPDKNSVVLSIAQGQDGFWNTLVKIDAGKLNNAFIGDDFCFPIVFNEDGSLFLLVDEHELSVLSFPDEDIVASCDLEDFPFVTSYGFLDGSKVLFLAETGLFVWDAEEDKTEEVIVEGFESKVTTYPNNPGVEDSISVDLTHISFINEKVYLGFRLMDEDSGILEIDPATVLKRIFSS